jgi:hypothetical protein
LPGFRRTQRPVSNIGRTDAGVCDHGDAAGADVVRRDDHCVRDDGGPFVGVVKLAPE